MYFPLLQMNFTIKTSMTREKLLSFFATILFLASTLFNLQAQEEPCDFENYHTRLLSEDENYRRNIELMEKMYRKKVLTGHFHNYPKNEVITIPIVFHVIHNGEPVGEGYNISDEQIFSSMDGMNIQYRNLNPDGSTYIADGTDLKFEFCLPQRDPDGNPTNGITRHDGTAMFANWETTGITNGGGGNDPEVKQATGWPRDQYYNVWVVPKINSQGQNGSGNVGYATFPGAAPATDGTVVVAASCGFDPDNKNPDFFLPNSRDNGTLVHEVGHGFALHHTFKGGGSDVGGGCPPAESDCLQDGDQVCDTDPHEGHLSTCKTPSDMNNCIGQPFGDVNEVRNYMNYSGCRDLIFTPGQRDRVRNTLETQRSYFNKTGTPNVCVPVFAYDAAIDNLLSPTGLYCDENVVAEFVLKNNGQNTITSVDFEYGIVGGTTNTFTWTGSIEQLETVNVTLPAIQANLGLNDFYVRVKQGSINGSNNDEYMPNDEQSINFEVINGNVLSLNVTNPGAQDRVEFIDENSNTVSSITLEESENFSSDICLPDGCYRLVYKDATFTHPQFGGTPPKYTLSTQNNYVIASGFDLPFFSGGSHEDVSDEFCLPFDPGFLEADFTANTQLIETGSTVKFTDLSTNNADESPTSWLWDFGDGNTSTVENPSHTYNAPGVYSVSLIVDNDLLPDTLEKIHYIKVQDPLTGCDFVNNFITDENEGSVASPTTNGKNIQFPSTSEEIGQYAERFYTFEKTGLLSIEFRVRKVVANSSNPKLNIFVYKEQAGKPAQVMQSFEYGLDTLFLGLNTIDISSSKLEVDGAHYIAFETNNILDTVVLSHANYRDAEDFYNTAYVEKIEQVNGNTQRNWKKVQDALSDGFPTSFDVTVNYSLIPEAKIESDDEVTCLFATVDFSGVMSKNVDSYKWTTTGAFAPFSFSDSLSTAFNVEGPKEVKLEVTGGCGLTDEAIYYIDIKASPTVTVETVDDVCSTGSGSAKAKVEGGAGDFYFEWNTSPVTRADEVFYLTPGNYFLMWKNETCDIDTSYVSFKIETINQVPEFEVSSTPTSCAKNNGTAKAVASEINGTYEYSWSSVDHPNFSSGSKGISGLAAGTYTVEVSLNGCTPRSQDIEVAASRNAAGEVETPDRICEGDSVILNATSTDSITWVYIQDKVEKIQTGSTITIDSVMASMAVLVKFTDTATGCEISRQVSVLLNPQPIAVAGGTHDSLSTYKDTVISETGKVFFSSAGTNAGGISWDFGDGETSNSKNPTYKYSDIGIYYAKLRTANGNCFAMDSVYVIITDIEEDENGGGGTGTSINENKGYNVVLYPNPSTGKIYLRSLPANATISLTDISGKQASIVKTNEDSFYIGDNATGIYYLEIELENKTERLRVVLQ